MIQLKYDSFETDMGIETMQKERLIWELRRCKKKDNRKTEILFLLFTLLTLYPYMPSEQFR